MVSDSKDLFVELGHRLRDALARRGVTARELAHRMAVSESSMSKKLRGSARVSIPDLLIICAIYDLDVKELTGGLPLPSLGPEPVPSPEPEANGDEKVPSDNIAEGDEERAWRYSKPQPPDPLSMVSPDRVAISV